MSSLVVHYIKGNNFATYGNETKYPENRVKFSDRSELAFGLYRANKILRMVTHPQQHGLKRSDT